AAFSISEEHGELAGVPVADSRVGHENVEVVVMIQVGGVERQIGSRSCRKHGAIGEIAVAVVQKQFDLIASPTVDYCIEGLVVSAEMAHCNSVRVGSGFGGDGRVGRRMKAAFAVTEQQGDIGSLMVGNDEIGNAIAVQVTDADVTRHVSGWKRRSC